MADNDILTEIFGSRKSANKQYIKILELAAKESESLVHSVLKTLIDNNNPVSFELVEAMVKSQTTPDAITDVYVADIDLSFYDTLIESATAIMNQRQLSEAVKASRIFLLIFKTHYGRSARCRLSTGPTISVQRFQRLSQRIHRQLQGTDQTKS